MDIRNVDHWRHHVVIGMKDGKPDWAGIREVWFSSKGEVVSHTDAKVSWGSHYGEDALQSLRDQVKDFESALSRFVVYTDGKAYWSEVD